MKSLDITYGGLKGMHELRETGIKSATSGVRRKVDGVDI